MLQNDKERVEQAIQKDSSRVYAARKLSKWFNVYFRIQIFGETIFEGNIPPTLFEQKGGEE